MNVHIAASRTVVLLLSVAVYAVALPASVRAQAALAQPSALGLVQVAALRLAASTGHPAVLTSAVQSTLAQRSLATPVSEVVLGSVIVTSAPFIGILIALTVGPGVAPCGLFTDDPVCEARVAREQRRANAWAVAAALPLGLGGGALIGHGGHLIRQIRQARSATPMASVRPRGLGLDLRLRF